MRQTVASVAPAVNKRLLVIGYGSLLSGYGLLAERRGGRSRLVASEAEPVSLVNARRGLAKPSSHGSYLAMDLEPIDPGQPIVASTTRRGEGIGALALQFEIGWLPAIARREEYDSAMLLRLAAMAEEARQPLGDFLLAIQRRVGFGLLTYRRALFEILGYTSPGYIFHPLVLEDGRTAIVAIGAGFDGSGDPSIVSRRREHGIDRLLKIDEALGLDGFDRSGQIGYLAECLAGGLHGVNVADLMDGFDPDAEWARPLAETVSAIALDEAGRFMQATSLDAASYAQRFAGRFDDSLAPLFTLAARSEPRTRGGEG